MVSTACRACCHLVGIVITMITIVLGVSGLVLLCVYPEGESGHWAGIGLMVGGAVAAILTLVYTCYTMHSHWKLWGCVDVSTPNSKLQEDLRSRMSHIDIPESSESGGPGDGESSKEGASSRDGVLAKDNKPLDWDPDAILPDRDSQLQF